MRELVRNRRLATLIVGSFFCAFFLMVPSLRASEHSKKLRLAYAGWGLETAIAWVGIEAGLFKKYDLDVEEVIIRDPPSGGVQALIGVDIFLGFGNPLNVLQTILTGGDIVFLGSHVSVEQFGFGVSSDISTMQALKGKKIGVSAVGGISDLVARVILRRAGLDPTKDVEMAFIGFSPQRMIALSQNLIQGTPLSSDVASEAKRRGIKVLEVKDVPRITALLMTTRSFIKKDEEAVRRFIKGYLAAIHFYLTRRNESIAIIRKYFGGTDPSALERMYDAFAAQLEPLPAPNREAAQALLDLASVMELKSKNINPADLFEPRFLEELRASGFIDKLYTEKVS